jgi:hypothetical protein
VERPQCAAKIGNAVDEQVGAKTGRFTEETCHLPPLAAACRSDASLIEGAGHVGDATRRVTTADYLQTQANRTRDPDRKAHYQRCADQYRQQAIDVGLKRKVKKRIKPLLGEVAAK